QVSEALAQGAKALTGGRANPKFSGLYYEPTVLVDVNHDMAVIREETFCPVLPIIKVRDAEQTLRLANDSRYWLDGCIFRREKEKARGMAVKFSAGTVCINDNLVNYIIPKTPRGGDKDSAFSRRHGGEAIRKYCYKKSIVIDRSGLKSDFPCSPATAK